MTAAERQRRETIQHARPRALLGDQPYREEPTTAAQRRRHAALNRLEARRWQQQAQQ